jgi:hypothetical protein
MERGLYLLRGDHRLIRLPLAPVGRRRSRGAPWWVIVRRRGLHRRSVVLGQSLRLNHVGRGGWLVDRHVRRRIEEVGQGAERRRLQGDVALGVGQRRQPLVRTPIRHPGVDVRPVRFGGVGGQAEPLHDQPQLGPRKLTLLLRTVTEQIKPARSLGLLVGASTHAHAH